MFVVVVVSPVMILIVIDEIRWVILKYVFNQSDSAYTDTNIYDLYDIYNLYIIYKFRCDYVIMHGCLERSRFFRKTNTDHSSRGLIIEQSAWAPIDYYNILSNVVNNILTSIESDNV